MCHYQVQQLDVPGVVHGLNASGYEYCADTLNSYDAFALPYALFFYFSVLLSDFKRTLYTAVISYRIEMHG